jgi:hypothetical protein
MPKTFFEPDNLDALAEIFHEAERDLQRRGLADPVNLDWTARRILNLAGQGLPPWIILAEISAPMRLETAGLPPRSGSDETAAEELVAHRVPVFDTAC